MECVDAKVSADSPFRLRIPDPESIRSVLLAVSQEPKAPSEMRISITRGTWPFCVSFA